LQAIHEPETKSMQELYAPDNSTQRKVFLATEEENPTNEDLRMLLDARDSLWPTSLQQSTVWEEHER
jgi:hypothetical protein